LILFFIYQDFLYNYNYKIDFKRMIEITLEQSIEYQKGVLGILNKVELNSKDDSMKEDLKIVYKLLTQLNLYQNPENTKS